MSDFLLEVGCEEIPARMLADGARELLARVTAQLEAGFLAPTRGARTFAGPRRLALLLEGIPARQADRTEHLVGPPADKAFDADGQPTRAGIGFAQKLGIDPMALERVATPKGLCVAGTKLVPGLSAAELLARILPEVILGQPFPKTMRWGLGEVRYVRAIRSVVALLDGEVVEFDIAGVRSGRSSFGHRFLGAGRIDIAQAGDYEETLSRENVVVDAARRSEVIREGLVKLSAEVGGTAEDDAVLREEVTYFIEQPHVILGRFADTMLELPHEVLVTSMKHHQKGFPIWRVPGQTLAPAFVAVANVPDVEGHIARGFERVLNARLADARFFWQEDRKQPLAARLERLEKVTFHEKLGSYALKSRRIEELAPVAARLLGASDEEQRDARAAAAICKADLSTGMVGEFAELQGIMGGLYLREEGIAASIWQAVYQHYRPLSMEGVLPMGSIAAGVAIADKVDTLVGCFGAGLVPSGTRDPFGLRRAALGVVRILLATEAEVDLMQLLQLSAELHARHPGAAQAAQGLPALAEWLAERVEFVLRGEGHRTDTLRAVLAAGPLCVRDVARRARDLSECRSRSGFEQAFTVFKRVSNIAGRSGDSAFDPKLFREAAERVLGERLIDVRTTIADAIIRRDYTAALERVRGLASPLNEFFEQVRVLDSDPALSENRQRLLRAIGVLVAPIGDLSQLQMEQGKTD